MAERPTRRPRFGYAAPSGQVAEPLAGVAAAGFAPGQRPPAQWINYLLHFTTAWVDYLAGPGWGAWGRTAHGGSAPVFTAVAGVAVDTDDTRAGAARLRYVAVGTKSGPAPAVAVSRTGRDWLERTAPTDCTSLRGVIRAGGRFVAWGAKTLAATWHTDTDNPSVASVLSINDVASWTEATDLSMDLVRDMVWDGVGRVVAVVGSTRLSAATSTDDGATWTPVIVLTVFSPSTYGTAVAFDASRGQYLVGSTGGAVVVFDPVAGTATSEVSLPSAPASVRLRLRAGGGVCVAWASMDASAVGLGDDAALAASRLWRSEDGGATWDEVTLPSAMSASGGAAIVTDVTYADGVWVATTTAAPYLWRSDDGGATWSRVPLPIGEESSWALYRAVYADGAVTATGLTWTVATTRATGLAPDATRVYSPEPGYLADAGYLRGRRIDTTAPTDGQVLVWDATGGVWTPETPSSGPTLSDATPAALGVAAAGVSTEAARADHVHEAPAGSVAGATTAEDMTGTGWTTTAGTGVTATWASSKLTISAASGSSAFTSVLSDTTRLGPSSSQWDVCARIDMMAGDGASPAAQVQLGFRVNSSNYFVVVYKTDDRTVGVFSNAAGSFVDSGFVAGPSSGQATGGDLWLRMTRLADGRIAAWWGVGTAGALPTAWTRTHLIDRAALTLAVPSSACTYIGVGWFGLGALSTTTTVDVLAIRTTWQGSL